MSDIKKKEQKAEQNALLTRLWEEFNRLNTVYFGGNLSLNTIQISTRKQYGGYYRKKDGLIVVSWQAYVAFDWDETVNTFRHEVAHIVHNDHSKAFWLLAEKLGCTHRYARVPEERGHAYCRYVYECPVCAIRLFRRRRLTRSSCAKCDKNFNPKFLLRLVSTTASRNKNT